MSNEPQQLLTLERVLETFPVSESTWWAGIKNGRYPRPVRLSPRRVAWLLTDINSLIVELAEVAKND